MYKGVFPLFGFILVLLSGCNPSSAPQTPPTNPAKAQATSTETPKYSFEVINTFSHDTNAFTQGLIFLNGALLESTGLNGQSTLRKVDLKTGAVLKQVEVPPQYFAEGMTVLNGKIFQVTWQNHEGFVYDLETFQLERQFLYDGEGWGLTTDGESLILSDGTDQIRFLDPITMKVRRTIKVYDHDHPFNRLNELEYVKGEIYANIWGANFIVRIDPATGKVLGVINFTGLLAPQDYRPGTDVLNGIAYDAAGDRLFVTGKRWPKLFEVRLKE
ncbi:MAG: glutamine cyclotransferase [Pedosphaera sp.]|nr:glutamine cyclotransferase [Pedosphaera sp.]